MEHVTIGDLEVPALGIGTARFDSHDACRQAVETALDIGYRRVDTAQKYGTERAVGDAISAAGPDREELFVTTKLETDNRARERVLDSTRRSVEKLRTDYVDLLLVHSPNETVPIEETIGAMNDLQRDGVVRHVGVSNFSVDQLREAMVSSETPIVANQVEYSPYKAKPELLSFCTDEDIMLTAYSPLAIGCLTEDATLAGIGDRYGKTAAQVAIRWLLQQEMVSAIPKSADPDHLAENFDVFDFELTDDEMSEIFEMARSLRSSASLSLHRIIATFE